MTNTSTRKDFETQEPLQSVHFEIGAMREQERMPEDRMLYFPVNHLPCTMDVIHSQPRGYDEYSFYVASSADGDFQPCNGMFLGFLEGEVLREKLPATAKSVQFWQEFYM